MSFHLLNLDFDFFQHNDTDLDGSNRRVELWQATLSQFFEAVGAVLPLPPEVRS